jgi:hypothetical protein
MTLPGFTAHVSLPRSPNRFRSSGCSTSSSEDVSPASLLMTFDRRWRRRQNWPNGYGDDCATVCSNQLDSCIGMASDEFGRCLCQNDYAGCMLPCGVFLPLMACPPPGL